MVSFPQDSPNPHRSWEGDGVDVEIERCGTNPPTWQWTLYDRARVVTSGVSHSRRWVGIRSRLAAFWYRMHRYDDL